MKTRLVLSSLLAGLFLPACTAEQAYGSGQAWQRNQCARIPDKAEYDRCMGKADTSYDSYKQQNESGRK
jgi:hypothetical protein